MKKARIPEPANGLVPRPEDLDDTADAERAKDRGDQSKESAHHCSKHITCTDSVMSLC